MNFDEVGAVGETLDDLELLQILLPDLFRLDFNDLNSEDAVGVFHIDSAVDLGVLADADGVDREGVLVFSLGVLVVEGEHLYFLSHQEIIILDSKLHYIDFNLIVNYLLI